MAAAKRPTRLDALASAVLGATSPFACRGELSLAGSVRILFPDGVRVSVVPAPTEAKQEAFNSVLAARSRLAAFGHGKKTRRDTRVRDALQLEAANGAFRIIGFDPMKLGIVEQALRALGHAGVTDGSAELYALNLYGPGGHFLPHKDTPRGDDMIGTLVVCLPSRFRGGMLDIVHRGRAESIDWGREIELDADPRRVRWAAFFGDVDHAIREIWSGQRVTLSYILRAPRLEAPASEPNAADVKAALAAALADPKFLQRGGVLGFSCAHMYTHDTRWLGRSTTVTRARLGALKGRDRHVGAAALALGLEAVLVPYVIETSADHTFRLTRLPTSADRALLGDRIGPDDIQDVFPGAGEPMDTHDPKVTWVIEPPNFNGEARDVYAGASRGEGSSSLPALEMLLRGEYSATGYFGNEGSDSEFYVYAALHVRIPRAGEGPRLHR